MAHDQIEVNEVADILDGMYNEMPCDEQEDRDYMRLIAANRLGKANDAELSKFKKTIISLLEQSGDHSPKNGKQKPRNAICWMNSMSCTAR